MPACQTSLRALPFARVDEVTLVRVRGGHVYLVLFDADAGRKFPVHSHESIGRALRSLPRVRDALRLP